MEYNKQEYITQKINNYYKKKSQTTKINKKLRCKRINERKVDNYGKVYDNIINRIYQIYKKYNLKFNNSYDELIGCDRINLKTYIEQLLDEHKTFNNYGEWEIDHIIPVSSFDLTKLYERLKCFHYTNLQPLWKDENRSKFNHII